MFASVVFIISFLLTEIIATNSFDTECPLGFRYRSKSNSLIPTTVYDKEGKEINTLQDVIERKAEYVSLALDSAVDIPIGTPICIPEFNRKYNRSIMFQYQDTDPELEGQGYSKCKIYVRDIVAKHSFMVNQFITLVVPNVVVIT